jgi:hypothetical protein
VVLGAKEKLRLRKDGFNGKVPSSYLEQELLTIATNLFFSGREMNWGRETNCQLKRVA